MKRFGGLLVVFLIFAAPAAEAAKVKLPKPIDSPIVRPKARNDHKPGKRNGDHPKRYSRPEWGAEWGSILSVKRPRPVLPWVMQP